MVSFGIRRSEWANEDTQVAFHLPQLDTLLAARSDTGSGAGEMRQMLKRRQRAKLHECKSLIRGGIALALREAECQP